MPSIYQVTVAAAMLGLSFAAPTKHSKRNGFRVTQIANPSYVKSGQAELMKTLTKWGGSQEKIQALAAAINPSSVTATPQPQDTEYLCPVTIGDQQFTLDFDTGSSDLWVFGQNSGASSHTLYTPSSSSSLLQGETWSISYGDGSSASGTVYSDTVTVGGTTVAGQAVESADTASSEFTSGVPDGLLGLAFDNINTVTPDQQSTFFTNAINAGLTGVLGADLRPGAPGSYDFGFLDDTLYTGDIAYTPIDNSQGFWAFTPDSITSGGQQIGDDAGIADTGTTLILVSDATAQAYYANVQGATNDPNQGGWVFDCSATLPDFTLVINGYPATVPGSLVNFAPQGNVCFGGIQSDNSVGQAIYGDVFLKSQYVVFDRSQSSPQLGVAAKSGN